MSRSVSSGHLLTLRRSFKARAILALMFIGAAGDAQAQPAPALQGSPLPRILPAPPPAVSRPSPTAPAPLPAEAAPAANVKVTSIGLVGATAFPQAELLTLAGISVGPTVPLATVEAGRLAILNRYRADGYVLTTVSASLDAQGALRFSVIEGRIVDVKLDGDIGPAGTQVLRFLRHLTAIGPVRNADLERWLLLAQDVPGVSLHAVLQPSAEDPGALSLVAQVHRQTLSGLLTADNRGYRLAGPEQALAVLDVNSLTQFGERTEFSFYGTARTTQLFGQASTELFVGGSGLKVRLYAGHGETTPSGFLGAIGYDGTTTVFGVSASYPVIRSRQQTLNVTAAFDAVESEITTAQTGIDQRLSRDSLRVLRAGGDYVSEDLLLGAERSAVNLVSLRLSHGLDGLGSTDQSNPNPGRPGERIDFFKATAALSRTQTLFTPWTGASVALKGVVSGQASGDKLPPTEKFYLGGAEFNRGFYSGQATGDQAVTYTAELQLNTSFDTAIAGSALNIPAQLYVFYDGGRAWQNTKLEPNVRLGSEGLGLRLNVTDATEFGVEGVIRNTRTFGGTSAQVRPLPANAIYWRALARF